MDFELSLHMLVQTTLFSYKLKKDEYIYRDPQNRYEQFVEHFYQCNRITAASKGKQELVKEDQVCTYQHQINIYP